VFEAEVTMSDTRDDDIENTTTDNTEPQGPDGCLACNITEVTAFLVAQGIDPARFVQCPPTRHAWADVISPCGSCGAVFLVKPAKNAEQEKL
jgi:hypothetical protein